MRCTVSEHAQIVLANNAKPKKERLEALKWLGILSAAFTNMHGIGEARGANDIHGVEFGSSQYGSIHAIFTLNGIVSKVTKTLNELNVTISARQVKYTDAYDLYYHDDPQMGFHRPRFVATVSVC